MADLVEWSLPIPEFRSSNPVIGKIHIEHLFTCLLSIVLKINKKRPGMTHFLTFEDITSLIRKILHQRQTEKSTDPETRCATS